MTAAHKRASILLHIDETAEAPLYQQIYEQFRDAISSGKLLQGDRLMSIRKLSADLGVSHTTVEQAYLQLATEGLVINVPRSGYVVEHIDTAYMALDRAVDEQAIAEARSARSQNAFFAENRSGHGVRYDFSFANLQPDSFPVDIWRKLTNDVLYHAHCPELARYSNTDEPGALRDELARHLARTRGVNCLADQVIPQAGTSDALTTLLQLFDRRHDIVGIEEPGYQTMHEVARRLGFNMAPLPVDRGVEGFLRGLDAVKPRIIFTTP